MLENCHRRNPLTRNGSNQDGRRLPALQPDYFQVDERGTADLLLFAERFSRHINFYDLQNQKAGDWHPFFSQDISAVLAALSNLPVEIYQSFARDLQAYLADKPGRAKEDLLSHFKLLFHLPLLLLQKADDQYGRLASDDTLREFMTKLVKREMISPLERLVSYYQGALDVFNPDFVDIASIATEFNDPNLHLTLPRVVKDALAASVPLSAYPLNAGLLDTAMPNGWNNFYTNVVKDTAPYEDSPGDIYGQIYDALNFNLLDQAFEQLFQSFERMVREANRYLEASLTAFAGHTPHYGLWLAFLRLFKHNRDHLNELTGRHLDYYYKDILHLCHQKAVPDHAHLLFTLNKNVDAHLLPAGTLFRGGKDDTGKEVTYALDDDIVVNRASIASLKSLYRPQTVVSNSPITLPYAASVTDSADGRGAELPQDKPHWLPFGSEDSENLARIGFAVADRQLFLREGQRTITLTVAVNPHINTLASGLFSALLTTDEGWLTVNKTIQVKVTPAGGELIFTVILDGEDPAIVPYNPTVHGTEDEQFPVSTPVMKVIFNLETGNKPAFMQVRNLTFSSMRLKVDVSDIRNVSLQNELGTLDTAKPFLPFGPTPRHNAPLILGSSELFSKPLADLKLHLTWAQSLTANNFYNNPQPSTRKVRLSHLAKGKWNDPTGYNTGIFTGTSSLSPSLLQKMSTSTSQTEENPPYTASSAAGFIRLELDKGFHHQAYIDAKTLALIELATGKEAGTGESSAARQVYAAVLDKEDPGNLAQHASEHMLGGSVGQVVKSNGLPLEPYTPKLNEFAVSYTSMSENPAGFFRLHPFGIEKVTASNRLFPALDYEGELYIGVADLEPPQRLSLLFQVADGTANPLKDKTTLKWQYLVGNAWQNFAEQDVDDKTFDLTQSGLVRLNVPAEADKEHTLLPAGYHWIRVSAEKDADAVNQLLKIAAQASRATFVDQGNDPAFLATPLPAGTISRLKKALPQVKKVNQPYPSFGGRAVENNADFYIRASERLRHKDRAVTMWDVEHLILASFPHIYRARCLNHTQLVRDANNNIIADNEVRPGYVLVVVIPYIQPDGSTDVLRPYTDKKTLGDIHRFLQARLSPFVCLNVQNPKFEEVQVQFEVAFTSDIGDVEFYEDQLNTAIRQYLTPWAYDSGADISFGGKWHKSAIINFVEELPYVNYVKNFAMFHHPDPDNPSSQVDTELIQATTSRSILVSSAEHTIKILPQTQNSFSSPKV